MAADDDPYEVGFKRPPKHSRFQPGQSGNPRGRPKQKPSIAADLARELAELIRIVDGAQEIQISKQRALVRALVSAAIAGDIRAATTVIGLSAKITADA